VATESSSAGRIPFKIHPRVFAALGADLVRNDVVAVIELVKNSYDAFATRVDVRFGRDETQGRYLEIRDDGCGMDRETLEEAWCVVATPYRREHPFAERGGKVRRVAGEKGLGRLSAARLGEKLDMLTRSANDHCWQVTVDWSALSSAERLTFCFATCTPFAGPVPFRETGTRLRIFGLKSEWDDEQAANLQENLARLISPFSDVRDFRIHMKPPGHGDQDVEVEVVAPEFLNWPPYAIRGHVTADGEVKAKYEFKPITRGRRRDSPVSLTWRQIVRASEVERKLKGETPGCGPFEFEVRAWDIGPDDTQEIADRFDIAKGNIRKAIHAHKGISVYRDGILVLPKSEDARDWLGLDLRRVSRVGTRLSTSQIVGYVSITATENRRIDDTSDREGLVQNPEVLAFEEILKATVSMLENQRDTDRMKPSDRVMLKDLLEGVSADDLAEEVSVLAEEGATASDVLIRVRDFNLKLTGIREGIKKRFAFYSRLATIGTIAQMLVHEIRNRTTAIGRFLRFARKHCTSPESEQFEKQFAIADRSVDALEHLADTFAPLASRSFKRGRRDATLEESIARCLALVEAQVNSIGVSVVRPRTPGTRLPVDPGELDTIILNLILNSLYWIQQSRRKGQLEFNVSKLQGGQRVRLTVHDSGTGVADEDVDKIFLPGVTRKPDGIGMGLTVAAELVSEYGGRMCLLRPGRLGGASFAFDLPVKGYTIREDAH